jgi:hypothetical protein
MAENPYKEKRRRESSHSRDSVFETTMNITQFLGRLQGVKKSGNGWTAKCPAHDDGTASLSIRAGDDKRILLHCHAGCTTEAICSSLGLNLSDLFHDNGHARRNGSPAKPKPVSVFDWQKCLAAFTEADAEKLAAERGLSIEFVHWLRAQGLLGIFDGKVAFANHGDGGQVVSAHVRLETGKWIYKPSGHKIAPLVFGDMKAARSILTFESQWDAFAVMDKLGWHTANGSSGIAIFITRGASNGKLIRGQVSPDATVQAFTQNDKAAQTWLADVAANTGCNILNVATPAAHKDVNDWTHAGAIDRAGLFLRLRRILQSAWLDGTDQKRIWLTHWGRDGKAIWRHSAPRHPRHQRQIATRLARSKISATD